MVSILRKHRSEYLHAWLWQGLYTLLAKAKCFVLSDSAKLLGLYMLTCPHCNLLGCFRLPIGYVASDLNWDEQQVAKALSELEQDQFLIRCEESGWTLIRSFLKHNPIENPNQGKAAFGCLKMYLPTSLVWHRFWNLLPLFKLGYQKNFHHCLCLMATR